MSATTNVNPAAPLAKKTKKTIRLLPEKGLDIAGMLGIPLLLLAIWQLYGHLGWIDTFFVSTPFSIAAAFVELIQSGELFLAIWASVRRAALAFLFGGGLGLVLGFIVGMFRPAEKIFDPSFQLLRLTPTVATAPLIILWFGFGETSKIVLVALGAFFPLYLSTIQAIRNIDGKLFEVGRVLQYSTTNQIVKVVLPASLPGILSGVRLSLGFAWLNLSVAELLGADSGIGYLMSSGQTTSRADIIFVGVIIFAVMGKLIDSFASVFDRYLLRWQDSYKG